VSSGKPQSVVRSKGVSGLSVGAFSPDGKRFVVASGDVATVWDADSGRLLSTLHEAGGTVDNASFDADGGRVVTAGSDGAARVWDATSGKLLATLAARQTVVPGANPFESVSTAAASVNDASFSPDGKLVVTASSDGIARVWSVDNRKRVATLTGHTNAVQSATLNHDGDLIVTTSADGTARIWNASNGQPLAVFGGGTGLVLSASFSSDGRLIVTTSSNGWAQVYSCGFCASRNELMTLARGMAPSH
jgi:WD40 repeat protein